MSLAFSPEEVAAIRQDFPILHRKMNGHPMVYLDSAVSSQAPERVIERMARYMREEHTNVHRGVSTLSQKATDAFELARERVRKFIHAPSSRELVWTRGTTEAINLVVQSWGRTNIRSGDEILLSAMEHHANIVPWQLLAEEKGAKIRVIPMNDEGELIVDEIPSLLNDHTKIIGITHVSNALGTINPIKEIVALAHAKGVPVLVDGAQAVPHLTVDVQDLDCDFYVFSGHKMCGPTGIGVLYGKYEHLKNMPPWQGGGSMILDVSWEKTTFASAPQRFEAGTPPIAQAIGLGEAAAYLMELGMARIEATEAELLAYATERLCGIPGLRILGNARHKAAVLSLVFQEIHPHDVGSILDGEGICVRAGHHCAQPVMTRFQVPATTRASLAFYNTKEEIDALVRGLQVVREVFA